MLTRTKFQELSQRVTRVYLHEAWRRWSMRSSPPLTVTTVLRVQKSVAPVYSVRLIHVFLCCLESDVSTSCRYLGNEQ